jgi:hypothetical protein
VRGDAVAYGSNYGVVAHDGTRWHTMAHNQDAATIYSNNGRNRTNRAKYNYLYCHCLQHMVEHLY